MNVLQDFSGQRNISERAGYLLLGAADSNALMKLGQKEDRIRFREERRRIKISFVRLSC